MTTTEHKLKTFARQVDWLERARPGAEFTMSFPDNVMVRVTVEKTPNGYRAYYFEEEGSDGRMSVGNIHGAYQRYAELCAPSFQANIDEILRRIELLDTQCGETDYTDTGEAWDLLYWIAKSLRAVKGELP